MRKKYIIILFTCFGLFLLLPALPEKASLTSVFRLTEEPATIVRGTSGSTLTVNISFGDDEVEQWIRGIESPYPLLFIDMDWAGRFPETIKLIKKKNIPVGLLGSEGATYEQNTPLFMDQVKRFEKLFKKKPLWFRTADEQFPLTLQRALWEAEVNALGSTVVYIGGETPPIVEGEIISVPHHRENRIVLTELKKLADGRTFKPLEDVLFGVTVKTKKIPE
ncbi:hypothetical protein FITA111629_12305 [Filibacter tadaridae]|uniref:NodB homology domain-containing protein n=1 Tax=Filibacter tadaridae TaxID=2483811 RepID=A0A3P5WT21_9BACL|nr:hypothetical protein [Filibacter tadaridae]VDC18119.1 hypothetical protein FILTAD_00040 [Filibacter tadaridae]